MEFINSKFIYENFVTHGLFFWTVTQQEAIDGADESDFERIRSYDKFATRSSEHGLTTSNVQKIIHSQHLHFDLVIDGNFFHESWLMFAYKFNAPVVSICKYQRTKEKECSDFSA